MSAADCDVLVVGAGPAGAAAATLFAEAGYEVRLVDRARFPRFKPCGEFLSPEATRILDRLGVEGAVRAAGARRLRGLLVSAYGEPPLRADFEPGARRFGYALDRTRLDAILVERARETGAAVFEGWKVEGLGEGAVRLRSPEGEKTRWRARLVVGAGGTRCPVARDLGLQRRPRGEGRIDLLSHWRPAEAARRDGSPHAAANGGAAFAGGAYCEMHVAGPGYTGLAPVGPDVLNVNVVVPRSWLRERARERRGRSAHGIRTELYHQLVTTSPAVARAVRGGAPLYPPVASDVSPLETVRATADGVLLLGDAALFIDPFTGQGLYLALRSAELAFDVGSAALAARDTGARRLAAYDHRRAREFGPKVVLSRLLQGILYRPPVARRIAGALRRDPRGARTLIGAVGDYLPPSRLLDPRFLLRLAAAGLG